MQKFIGVKLIAAIAMTVGDAMRDHGVQLSPNPSGKERADGEQGYLVEYDNGYKSWSPKCVFEDAYRPINAMTFGLALEALKRGERVARAGWNGKGMWLVLIHPGNAMHTSSSGSFDMQPCIGMKTAQGTMQPGWLASQTDMLAEDWVIVE